MKTSVEGIQLIKSFESCRLKAYKLPGEKYYTIGYGHSYDVLITANTVWTQQQADVALANDLLKYERYVEKWVDVPLNDKEFSALVSYTYNRGEGGIKQLSQHSRTIDDYAKNIVVYWGSATRYKKGLIRRRKKEQELFVSGAYPTIRRGSEGEYVGKLQEMLKINQDNVFTWTTETTLKIFQTDNGLTPDGICGKKSWCALINMTDS